MIIKYSKLKPTIIFEKIPSKIVNKIEVNRISKILIYDECGPSPFYALTLILFKYTSTYCVPQVAQQQTTSERTIIGELLVLEVSVTSVVELETHI